MTRPAPSFRVETRLPVAQPLPSSLPASPPPSRASHADGREKPAGAREKAVWRFGPSGKGGDECGAEATVVDIGQGVPVVFLHGLVGLNEHWEGVVDRVLPSVRCILFELPLLKLRGEDCSIQGATRLTERFLSEKFGWGENGDRGAGEPVVLVGNSFGGHVALRIALDSPHLVRGLVLAGSSGLIEKSMVSDVQIRPSREWLRRKIGELFHDQSKMREADLERAFQELSDRGGARAMVKLSRSARRDHLGERIAEIACPTLLLWGRQDIVTPPEAAQGFLSLIRRSRLEWLEECGHAPMIERPEEFAERLLRFAEELRAEAEAGAPAPPPANGKR
jgi:pimeloyl-ACP methyl ester carboxylesterase